MAETPSRSLSLTEKVFNFIGREVLKGVLIYPFVVILGCAHIDDSDTIAADSSESDTTIEICGIKYDSISLGMGHPALNDFISFSEQYCSNFPAFKKTMFMDTTGNGVPEKVTLFVSFTSNQINIQNTIHNKNGNLLWRDKISLDKSSASKIFGNSEVFNKFYPLSALYAGITSAAFIDSLDRSSSNYDSRKKELLRHITNLHDIEDLQVLYESELSKFIDTYQGKYLFTLDQSRRKIYMWSEEKNAFIPLTVS